VDKLTQIEGLRQRICGAQLQDCLGDREEVVTLDTLAEAATRLPGLHEIQPQSYRDGPAAMGFACALAAMAARRRTGTVIWIAQARGGLDFGRPYGPGLARIGIDPGRVLVVDAPDDKAALWAAAEGAKAAAGTILVQALGEIGLTAARRLHLAAAQGGAFAAIVRPHQVQGLGPALTRWRTAGAQGTARSLTQWATPRWRVGLERRRDGPPGPAQILEWDHAAHRVRLGSLLGIQTSDAGPQSAERPRFGAAFRRAG
jgi:protein ImuA